MAANISVSGERVVALGTGKPGSLVGVHQVSLETLSVIYLDMHKPQMNRGVVALGRLRATPGGLTFSVSRKLLTDALIFLSLSDGGRAEGLLGSGIQVAQPLGILVVVVWSKVARLYCFLQYASV